MGLFRALAAVLLMFVACGQREETAEVSLRERLPEEQPAAAGPRESGLRVALGGMITPRKGLAYYLEFLKGVEARLGIPITYIDREDYGEINRMLKSGEVDFGFVCSGPYVDGHAEFGLELLVAPQAYGQTVYNSYIIVPAASPVREFDGLRGRRFAFSDPLSNTGCLVPRYLLARMNESPESFFSEYTFSRGHDKSIQAVAQGLVDGAAVDSLIWEYENRTAPRYTSRTRIILKSPPYGIPPVVVGPGVPAGVKGRLRRVFLDADRDEGLREAMRGMMIERFVVVDDAHYDSVREMKRWVEDAERKAPPPAPPR